MLKAVGWVESNWRQFTPQGRPLVSFDFGYGIMQITSGMAGAYGNPAGSIDPATQSKIATDYRYNIAYGARMLLQKWYAVPTIGNGDPTAVEDWYYALWAYNGWGWVNNPNNPRFTRRGTPATDPATYPYQERVLYLVAHPPKDNSGRPLWPAVHVSLPSRSLIGRAPGPYRPPRVHRQPPPPLSAIYRPGPVAPLPPSRTFSLKVRVTNTGTSSWIPNGTQAVSLTYDLMVSSGNPFTPLTPFTPGMLTYGQAAVPVSKTVEPGRSTSFQITVQAPSSAGTYWLILDLATPDGTSFSSKHVLPGVVPVVVGQSPPPSLPTPTATPVRLENEAFVADTSVPDGSILAAHSRFLKGWLVFNNGRVAWSDGWTLHQVRGKHLGPTRFSLPATSACHTLNLLVPLKAPGSSRRYASTWRVVDPEGKQVGDKLTIVFSVRGGPTATPVPRTSPTPTATATGGRATPTPTSTPIG